MPAKPHGATVQSRKRTVAFLGRMAIRYAQSCTALTRAKKSHRETIDRGRSIAQDHTRIEDYRKKEGPVSWEKRQCSDILYKNKANWNYLTKCNRTSLRDMHPLDACAPTVDAMQCIGGTSDLKEPPHPSSQNRQGGEEGCRCRKGMRKNDASGGKRVRECRAVERDGARIHRDSLFL